ncbi:T-cell-specific surface glycoprotein CD28 [Dissostichus eleginoides]|uniref:T-cell-specific surface glycoprotein CD28 n=1 Tax=Dissostichus eleginoides TaxID=100907 RepID=A0AAD9B434_DISEL|nr:T-cell-specific surface glycoprotein CD28 [Dissostichus eleginoides]
MRACWMFMFLLSCRLSQAAKKQDLKMICVPFGDNVTVPCPELNQKDVTFKFLKNEEMISNHKCIFGLNNTRSKHHTETKAGVELHENRENQSVNFMLTGVNATSFGLYRCEATVFHPPPIETIPSTVFILVQVEGHHCGLNTKAGGDQTDGLLWIWILGIVVLGIYGVTATIIAGIFWVKWRSSESDSDYMNTKPKAPRDRRKNKWVQNPGPRHFS